MEQLANVAASSFVEQSLAKAANSRSTARFEVRAGLRAEDRHRRRTRARCTKEIEKLEAEFARNGSQLANQSFLAKAPAKVVEGLETRRAELKSLIAKSKARLAGFDVHGRMKKRYGLDQPPRITAILANALLEDQATRDATSHGHHRSAAACSWQPSSPSRIAFWLGIGVGAAHL